MSRRVCFAYQWATYGGVERVFLNRAQAFKALGRDIDIEIHYGSDGGGLAAFNKSIKDLGLQERMRVVQRLDPGRYDAVFVIDSPALLPSRLTDDTRWVMECHTPYADNREYLRELPASIAHVVAPSHTFARLLREERPEIASRVRLLRNCVAPAPPSDGLRLPAWKQQPLLYFGRLDELKNPQGFIDLFGELERRTPGRYFGLIVGPELQGYGMASRIDMAQLRGKVVQLPPIPFLRTSALLAGWRGLRGAMISPSHGESFGLAAAEAIAAGVPVLLSALPEHSELTGGDLRHLYDPGDIVSGADKIEEILADYSVASDRMLSHARAFSDEAFISDWENLMQDLGLADASAVARRAIA